jgi:RNA polymerase sigma-70 factor (ECF subfamily)
MPDDEASDRSLVRRFRDGQADAPTQLYLRYAQRLHALATKQTSAELARRVDPEDIVQSVFRTFFRRLSAGNYDVPDGEEIWKLLLVMALNKIRTTANFHKAAKRDVRRTYGGEALEAGSGATTGGDEAAMTVLRLVVDELLQGLPESHRKMVEARIEGHEVAQIADEVGRSKRSVERVLQEFRTRLGALIHEGD